MRYVITYMNRTDEGKHVYLLQYACEIANSHDEAVDQFSAKHPDRLALHSERIDDERAAFERFGMGAWTDEEQAEHRARQEQRNAVWRDEHDEARDHVGTYTLDEFYAEQEYQARRDSEETPNLEGVHIGDIFYACWGYDQTNYDFYQVVALRGKHTAVVRENACKEEMCSDWNGYKRPIRDTFKDETTYSLRTSYSEYYKCPQMKVPDLSGNHHMTPAEYGKLYSHSTGA